MTTRGLTFVAVAGTPHISLTVSLAITAVSTSMCPEIALTPSIQMVPLLWMWWRSTAISSPGSTVRIWNSGQGVFIRIPFLAAFGFGLKAQDSDMPPSLSADGHACSAFT